MKAVLVLLVLALGAFAVRGEDAAAVQSADAAAAAPTFVPQAAELEQDSEGMTDMDADTAEEELLDSESEADNDEGEDESESEVEGDAENEFEDMAESDAEVDAEAVEQFEQEDENESDEETEGELEGEEEEGTEFSFAELDSETEGPRPIARLTRRAAISAKRRPIIAPRAIMKPVKFHSERIVAATARAEDPEMAKLNLALDAVKEDILSTNKQITDERKWVIAVAKIIASYNDKMKRVEKHIIALRKEMKALYRKKKQIENLKLQKALEAKLREARDELATLTNSLKHVAVKQGELNKSGADLRQTIAGIQSQLAKLRGQQLRKPRPAAKGKGKRRGGKGKGKGKGRRGCRKGFRFSRKAKRCVPGKRRAGRR